MADGLFLRFDGFGRKKYAQLPAGEYGYSDAQGLYEWRRLPDGRAVRIDYTGGDSQASDRSGFWTRGCPGGSIQDREGISPALLGFHAAMDPARMN